MLTLDWHIIFNIINILVLFLLLRHFLYAPVMKVIEERKRLVEEDLTQAAAAKQEAMDAKTQATARLEQVEQEARTKEATYEAQARQQAEALLADARQEAEALVEQGKLAAQQERDRMLQQAGQETADLACTLAAKLVGRNMNREDDKRFLDELMDKVGETCGK